MKIFKTKYKIGYTNLVFMKEPVYYKILKRRLFLFIPYWSERYLDDRFPYYTKTREQAEQLIKLLK